MSEPTPKARSIKLYRSAPTSIFAEAITAFTQSLRGANLRVWDELRVQQTNFAVASLQKRLRTQAPREVLCKELLALEPLTQAPLTVKIEKCFIAGMKSRRGPRLLNISLLGAGVSRLMSERTFWSEVSDQPFGIENPRFTNDSEPTLYANLGNIAVVDETLFYDSIKDAKQNFNVAAPAVVTLSALHE